MDSRELREWMAYEAVTGPLGVRRGDYHAAMVMAAVINSMRGKKSRPVRPEKLLPWDVDKPQRREQSPDEMLRAVKSMNRRLGGREVRHGDVAGPRHQDPDQEGSG